MNVSLGKPSAPLPEDEVATSEPVERQEATEEPSQAVDLGPSPGRLLRDARESLSVERAHVARSANLTLALAAAVESDDFERLGIPVYARGYYRRYAKALDIDVADVLAAYEKHTATVSPVPQIESRPDVPVANAKDSAIRLWLIGAAALLIIVLAFVFLTGRETVVEDVDSSAASADLVESAANETELLPLTEARQVASVDFADAVARSEAEEPAIQPAINSSVSQSSADEAVASSPAVTSPSVTSAHSAPASRLEIQTGPEAAWIEVLDAMGERLIYRIVNPEETVFVDGEPPYSVNLGMAHTLRVRYGGKELDLQPATDSASRVRATIAANGEVIGR